MRQVVKFFVLTYAVMWACFISVAAAGIPVYAPLGGVLVLLGTFAPSLVALWLTARTEGDGGVRALLGGVLRWRVAVRWYLFALAYIPAIKLTVALVHRVATGAWPHFGDEPWYLILGAIAVSRRERRSAGAAMRFPAWRRASDSRARASCSGSSGPAGTYLSSSSPRSTRTDSHFSCLRCK